MNTERTKFYVDIRGCARCGGNHEHTLATPFPLGKSIAVPALVQDPPRVFAPVTYDYYDYWATCPTTGAPILVSATGGV